MLPNRIAALAAFGFTVFLAASCARPDRVESIPDVIRQRVVLDGERIAIRGYIEVDAMDHPNFVPERGPPRGELVTNSIDVVSDDAKVRERLTELDGACVVVNGKFHLYRPNEVRLGNLVSLYGLVNVQSVYKCK